MSELPRRCFHCRDLLPPEAAGHTAYCNKAECQRSRRRLNEQRYRTLHAVKPTCEICGRTFELIQGHRSTRRTCYEPLCQTELKRRLGKAGMERYHQGKEKKLIDCLGSCGKKFLAEIGPVTKMPVVHFCEKCRGNLRNDDEYRWAEAWG